MCRPLIDIEVISKIVERRVRDILLPQLPSASDGEHRFTLFGRYMPSEWLWEADKLLPAIVSVGRLIESGEIMPLRPDKNAFLGYALNDDVYFGIETIDHSVKLAKPMRYYYDHAGNERRRAWGHHLEMMHLFNKEAYCKVLTSQGLELTSIALKAWGKLPHKIFDSSILEK